MTKTTRVMGAVLAGCAMLALSALSAAAADQAGFETYVVREGDTLSKIAGRVFGSQTRWREILKANPQVTNANRIYPGDALLVPVPMTAGDAAGQELAVRAVDDAATAGQRAAGTHAAGEVGIEPAVDAEAATSSAGEETIMPEPPVERERPAAVVNPALYRSAGYLADTLPALAIVATQDDRLILGTYDAAIVNAPIAPGNRYAVVRADRRIFHPNTGADLGWLTRVLGTAEVTCRGERTSTAMLQGMRDVAGVGDYLVPLDPNDVLKENTLPGKAKSECISPGTVDGVVVAFDDDRLAAGEQEFAYIDRGRASDVAPGHRFVIYREVAPEGDIMVGELQVLRVGERSATALITTSIMEVLVGDLLRARRP